MCIMHVYVFIYHCWSMYGYVWCIMDSHMVYSERERECVLCKQNRFLKTIQLSLTGVIMDACIHMCDMTPSFTYVTWLRHCRAAFENNTVVGVWCHGWLMYSYVWHDSWIHMCDMAPSLQGHFEYNPSHLWACIHMWCILSATETYTSAKEPYISAKEPEFPFIVALHLWSHVTYLGYTTYECMFIYVTGLHNCRAAMKGNSGSLADM